MPLVVAALAFLGTVTVPALAQTKSASVSPTIIEQALQPKKPVRVDWEKEVLVPLKTKQAEEEAALKAAQAAQAAAEEATRLAQRPVVYTVPTPVVAATNGVLTGSLGYAKPYGNCVLEPGVNNPGWGNQISWPVVSGNPWIGATALFTYNHVGVVTGIWSNGDLEIRHQNFTGGQTRYPRSAFRGFR